MVLKLTPPKLLAGTLVEQLSFIAVNISMHLALVGSGAAPGYGDKKKPRAHPCARSLQIQSPVRVRGSRAFVQASWIEALQLPHATASGPLTWMTAVQLMPYG